MLRAAAHFLDEPQERSILTVSQAAFLAYYRQLGSTEVANNRAGLDF
jgi:hypothetical protein